MSLKFFIEGKVVAFEEKKDPKNAQIIGVVVFETKKNITSTLEGVEFIKAKTLIKPSEINKVLRFEVEIFSIKGDIGVNNYYRLLKEVK